MNNVELFGDYESEYFQCMKLYWDYIKSELLWKLI